MSNFFDSFMKPIAPAQEKRNSNNILDNQDDDDDKSKKTEVSRSPSIAEESLSRQDEMSSTKYEETSLGEEHRDMTEDEVNELVQKALRRARKSTTLAPKSNESYMDVGGGIVKPSPDALKSVYDTETNGIFQYQSSTSFDSTEGSFSSRSTLSRDKKPYKETLSPRSTTTEQHRDMLLKTTESAGSTLSNINNHHNDADDVIQRIEAEIACAKRAAIDAQRRLQQVCSDRSDPLMSSSSSSQANANNRDTSDSWSIDGPPADDDDEEFGDIFGATRLSGKKEPIKFLDPEVESAMDIIDEEFSIPLTSRSNGGAATTEIKNKDNQARESATPFSPPTTRKDNAISGQQHESKETNDTIESPSVNAAQVENIDKYCIDNNAKPTKDKSSLETGNEITDSDCGKADITLETKTNVINDAQSPQNHSSLTEKEGELELKEPLDHVIGVFSNDSEYNGDDSDSGSDYTEDGTTDCEDDEHTYAEEEDEEEIETMLDALTGGFANTLSIAKNPTEEIIDEDDGSNVATDEGTSVGTEEDDGNFTEPESNDNVALGKPSKLEHVESATEAIVFGLAETISLRKDSKGDYIDDEENSLQNLTPKPENKEDNKKEHETTSSPWWAFWSNENEDVEPDAKADDTENDQNDSVRISPGGNDSDTIISTQTNDSGATVRGRGNVSTNKKSVSRKIGNGLENSITNVEGNALTKFESSTAEQKEESSDPSRNRVVGRILKENSGCVSNDQEKKSTEKTSSRLVDRLLKENQAIDDVVTMNKHSDLVLYVNNTVSEEAVDQTKAAECVLLKEPYPRPQPVDKPRPPQDIIRDFAVGPAEKAVGFSRPKNELKELILAAKGSSLQRRSNACGSIKVLTLDKKNQLTLARTQGFLDSLVFAASANLPAKDQETAIDARTRAVTVLFQVSRPKDNRGIVFSHRSLPECLVKVISEDRGEARAYACAALAMLAKTDTNREEMADIENLVSALAKVLVCTEGAETLENGSEEDPEENIESDGSCTDQEDDNGDDSDQDDGSSIMTHEQSMSDGEASTIYQQPAQKSQNKGKSQVGTKERVDSSIRVQKGEQNNEFVERARLNACAVLSHLSKHCSVTYKLAENELLMESLRKVSLEFDNEIHTKCIEILCHLTRFPANCFVFARNPSLLDSLLVCGASDLLQDRIWALRTLQNMATDSSSKIILVSNAVLTLLSSCALHQDHDEQLAAVATLYNLSTDPGAVVPLTNTKNVVATLVHIAHNHASPPSTRQMACDAIATIGLWLQSVAGNGNTPNKMEKTSLPSHTSTGWERWH